MCGDFLSIKEGKVEAIQLIKFKKQCPHCGNAIGHFEDTEMNLLTVICGFCGKKYRIPINDYADVPRLVEHEV